MRVDDVQCRIADLDVAVTVAVAVAFAGVARAAARAGPADTPSSARVARRFR
jgi:hypothetical protein